MNSTSKITLLAIALLLLVGGIVFLREPVGQQQPALVGSAAKVDSAKVGEIRPQVEAFCGDCHATPQPDSFPKDAWFHEVNRGYEFYYESGRSDLRVPIKQEVYAFYRSQAPESLVLPPPSPPNSGRLVFRRAEITIPSVTGSQLSPAVAHLGWCTPAEFPSLRQPTLFVSDMRLNQCQALRFPGGQVEMGQGVSVGHLAHTEATDLDRDGNTDFVLSDLGSFLPEEHNRGRVLWMRTGVEGEFLEPIELASGLGRVADARPGDFDGDGDLDLVVAEFGLIKTGRILLLENQGVSDSTPHFEMRVLDPRHGAIHTPVVDLNGDGLLDFIALISQEHETVEAFLNDGQGGFTREVIFLGKDPSYGSSGIELVDLDQDGDVDVLYTNGDMYDSYCIKPYHAIHWLENQGDARWHDHVLTNMPGVFRALAADLDRDGDLDIAAVALIPENVLQEYGILDLDSVVWLEQVRPGQFTCRSLETGETHHATLEIADFDGDGDADLAVGNFQKDNDAALTVWWNDTPASNPPK